MRKNFSEKFMEENETVHLFFKEKDTLVANWLSVIHFVTELVKPLGIGL